MVDAHPTVRLGVRGLLADRYHVEEAKNGDSALELLTSIGDFDVVIVELRRDGGGALAGTAAIRALKKAQPGLGIVAHGSHPERHTAGEALRAGASAYVAKCSPTDALSQAVDAAAEAGRWVDTDAERPARRGSGITRRQRQILQLIADGQSTVRAANSLGLSTETIRTHTKALLARLDARDRAHAVAIGLRNGLID